MVGHHRLPSLSTPIVALPAAANTPSARASSHYTPHHQPTAPIPDRSLLVLGSHPHPHPVILPCADTDPSPREQAGETKDLETDPTLQRSPIQCPVCFKSGAVFYQDQAKRQTTNMTLFYHCIHCKHLFRDPNIKTR